MPLDKSCSLDAFKANVRASYKEGKTAKGTQHVAIALSTLKRACGVKDDDRRMSPKDIVAVGQKGESMVRVDAIVSRATEPVLEIFSDAWIRHVGELAEAALREAVDHRRGPATDRLLGWINGYVVRRSTPTFESRNPGSEWGPWRGWLSRLEMSAANEAVFELGAAVRDYRLGQIAVPNRHSSLFGEGRGRRGPDFAVRTSARGVGTSPSAAPPDANNRTNSGTFRAFVDDGEVKSGDGRAPRPRRRA